MRVAELQSERSVYDKTAGLRPLVSIYSLSSTHVLLFTAGPATNLNVDLSVGSKSSPFLQEHAISEFFPFIELTCLRLCQALCSSDLTVSTADKIF